MYIKKKYDLNLHNDYSNMTIRDNEFHILNNNKIFIYDGNVNKIAEKELSKSYKLLTYNSNESLYLTHLGNTSKEYYKVNFNYETFDNLIEKSSFLKRRAIKDIFFDAVNLKYIIIDNKKCYSIDLNGKYLQNEINVKDFYDIPITSNCCLIDPDIPNFNFTAIAKDDKYKYVAYNKNNSSYLAKISLNGNLINKLYIDDDIKITSLVKKDNLLYALINYSNNNYLYEISLSDDILNSEIQEVLATIIILLNNINFTETEIANIINVEANKIKYALNTTTDLDLIIDVNNSAKEMINSIGVLEQNEYENLKELLLSIKELEKYLNN